MIGVKIYGIVLLALFVAECIVVNKSLDNLIGNHGKTIAKIVDNNTKLTEEKLKLDEQEDLNIWN